MNDDFDYELNASNIEMALLEEAEHEELQEEYYKYLDWTGTVVRKDWRDNWYK